MSYTWGVLKTANASAAAPQPLGGVRGGGGLGGLVCGLFFICGGCGALAWRGRGVPRSAVGYGYCVYKLLQRLFKAMVLQGHARQRSCCFERGL